VRESKGERNGPKSQGSWESTNDNMEVREWERRGQGPGRIPKNSNEKKREKKNEIKRGSTK
jgi:hypothetical protein